MKKLDLIAGNGEYLLRAKRHPYIGRDSVITIEQTAEIIHELNLHRDNGRGPDVEVDYYFEVENDKQPTEGMKNAVKMVLEHGTVKPWHKESNVKIPKPKRYDENMSRVLDFKLLGFNKKEGIESGLVTIAYPLAFFDKTGGHTFPLSQLMTAIAGEPFSAFSFYIGAKIVDVRFPTELKSKFSGIRWSHSRIRDYLRLGPQDPIIGTIVKPKTGLTRELFSSSVLHAALAGARFTKADENMHLALKDVPGYVEKTVRDLQREGFDLERTGECPKGKRFLFAPHITAEPKDMMEYAKAAVESGANALMFSPYYAGGFQMLADISQKFDVPIYSHTAGMNVFTGSHHWGIDPRIMYMFAANCGAAFMQLTAVDGYLKPDDTEKEAILLKLKSEKLDGEEGMTLVIAGGIGAHNIGRNVKILGTKGRMFLAGTSVYSHRGGPAAGVKAILLAYRAFCETGATEVNELMEYGKSLGEEGSPLVDALT